jgi:hypothetical protein
MSAASHRRGSRLGPIVLSSPRAAAVCAVDVATEGRQHTINGGGPDDAAVPSTAPYSAARYRIGNPDHIR